MDFMCSLPPHVKLNWRCFKVTTDCVKNYHKITKIYQLQNQTKTLHENTVRQSHVTISYKQSKSDSFSKKRMQPFFVEKATS